MKDATFIEKVFIGLAIVVFCILLARIWEAWPAIANVLRLAYGWP